MKPFDGTEVFDSVNPLLVHKYLLDSGWIEKEIIEGRSIILSIKNESNREFSVFLPLDKTIPDFSYRMAEVFKALEVFDRHLYLNLLSTFTENNSH